MGGVSIQFLRLTSGIRLGLAFRQPKAEVQASNERGEALVEENKPKVYKEPAGKHNKSAV